MNLGGPILHMDQFYKTDGTDRLLAHTLQRVYVYNTSMGEFDIDITGSTLFTGEKDDFWTVEIMGDKYIFNNGVDRIKKWDMITPAVEDLVGATAYRCKKLLKFGERLNLYHTIETGTPHPQRVRWSCAGLPEDFTGVGSGASDLTGVMGVDYIQNADKLGNYVVIYGERTISVQEYSGDYNQPFNFYSRLSGVGLAAPRALCNLGEEHIFLGWDNIYSYSGGRDIKDVGASIKDELFDLIDPAYIHTSFMFLVEELDLLYLWIQTSESDYPDRYYVYDIVDKNWSRGKRDATGFGYYESKSTMAWDDAVGSWDAQRGRWDSRQRQQLSPITLVGNQYGTIHQMSLSENDLEGDAIDGYWDTKDFVQKDGYQRKMTQWMEFNFEAFGDSVDVSYSTDEGNSWSTAVKFTLTDRWKLYNLDVEVWSPQVRFRFRNNTLTSTFNVRHFEMGFLVGSDRGVA